MSQVDKQGRVLWSFYVDPDQKANVEVWAKQRGEPASETLRGLIRDAQSGAEPSSGELPLSEAGAAYVNNLAGEFGKTRVEVLRVLFSVASRHPGEVRAALAGQPVKSAADSRAGVEPGLLDRLGVPPMRARGTARQGRKER